MTNQLRTTYLLAWNPKNFGWDRLDEEIKEVAEKGGASSWWSSGNVRNIPVGSRVYLIRLVVDPRGIVGSGYTTGEVADHEHWQPERRAAGDRMNRLPLRFDVLVRSPLIRRAELEGPQFAGYKWDTQMSGVRIPPEVARELELLWNQRVEGAKRGETLPTVLPSDVDRWRAYLRAANEDVEYLERHRLRDKRRMEVNPALGDLVGTFANGAMSLADFKEQFDSKTRVEWEVLGLKGPAGAMFLNQVAKNVPDQDAAEQVMRAALKIPVSTDDARTKIDEVVGFLDRQQESGGVASNALRPANASFFLSACWNAQNSEMWPTFFQSARKALQEDGLLSRNLRGGDGYVAFVDVFSSLAKALGISFLTLEHLCDHLHSGEARGLGGDDQSEEGEEQELQGDRSRVWLVAPGPRAHMFDDFYKEGVIGIGWPEVGDLSQYVDLASVKAALQAHRGGDVSPVQDAYACYQFVHEMQVGDLVYAKKGRREIVGYGVVTGEYRHEPLRGDYPNVRAVEWKKRGSWVPREKALVTKTLTDVGKYPQLVADLKLAVGAKGDRPVESPPSSVMSTPLTTRWKTCSLPSSK